MSQARAISKPPPKAAPSIAAIVGVGRLPLKEKKSDKQQENVLIMYKLNQLHETTASTDKLLMPIQHFWKMYFFHF